MSQSNPPRQNQKTPVWQVKANEEFVKTALISEIIEPGDKVCEFNCVAGDMGKWHRAKISSYIGIDPKHETLAQTQARWIEKNKPFSAEFIALDPFTESLEKKMGQDVVFDSVCCFHGLEFCFETQEKAKTFLQNISSRLKVGGYFFGIVPDSSAIWYKAQGSSAMPVDSEDIKLKIEGSLYSIQFPSDQFNFFGTRYFIKLKGSSQDHTEYLVHFPSLIRLAKEFGLIMLEITNLQEFIEDNRKNFAEHLKRDNIQKIEPPQKEIIGFYAAFIFRKATPVEEALLTRKES